MNTPPDLPILDKALEAVQEKLPEGLSPVKAVICGSGWGDVIQDLSSICELSYEDIPGFGATGVVGHHGILVVAETAAGPAVIFKGRRHFYEGEGWTPIAVPIYLSLKLGVRDLLLTNSAGAVHPDFQVGDLMVITDHINLIGDNPLVGPHHEVWGPRFPDLSTLYGQDAQSRMHQAAATCGLSLQSGVYAATRGPVYETPAEVQAWKTLGADAVGMSTVPEAILAHAAGIRVTGVSCMTNFAAGISPAPLSHEEVTASTQEAMPRMKALVKEWLNL